MILLWVCHTHALYVRFFSGAGFFVAVPELWTGAAAGNGATFLIEKGTELQMLYRVMVERVFVVSF